MIQRNRFPITFIIVMILLRSSIITCSSIPQRENHLKKGRLPTIDYGVFEVCDSVDCDLSAQQILMNMNPSVDPCDDFYEFACGNFGSENDKFNSNAALNVPESITDRQMRFILEQPLRQDESGGPELLKEWFENCTRTDFDDTSRIEELTFRMKNNGGFPLVLREKWDEKKFKFPFDYFRYPSKFDEYNSTMKLTVEIISLKKYVEFFQPTVNESFTNENIHECLRNEGCKYMLDVVAMLGAPRDNSTMNELIETIEFARKFQNIVDDTESEELLIYDTKLTKDEAKEELYWKIMYCHEKPVWSECIFNTAMNARYRPTKIISESKSDRDLVELLRNTPRRCQANFAAWKRIKGWFNIVKPSMLKNITSILLQNEISEISIADECVAFIRMTFSEEYIMKYFDENNREISIMFNNMKNKLKQKIPMIHWINSGSEEKISDIIDDMKIIDKNTTKFENAHYRLLTLRQVEFSEKLLTTPSLKYIQGENLISIDTTIFNGTSFRINVPKYLNYGGLGVTIGREISAILHRAESENPEMWKMINETVYFPKIECFMDQYKKIITPKNYDKISSILTGNTIIGDIMGLKLAYLAYGDFEKEPRLSGLEQFTPRQLFWINAANNWCVKRNELARAVGDQTPEEIRVRGSFSSLDEFAMDFKCPRRKSIMNPQIKCSLMSFRRDE